MPLAGNQDDVGCPRRGNRTMDRTAAVPFDLHVVRVSKPRQDVRDDRVAVLASGVVVGDDDSVGALLHRFRHLRPLAAVPLAAAAEHAPEVSLAQWLERGQRAVQGIGGMGVVHDDQWPRSASEPLHSARDRLGAAQPPEHGVEPMPVQARDRDGCQQVVRVEAAEETRRHRSIAPGRYDLQREPPPFPGDAAPDGRQRDRRRRCISERQCDGFDAGRNRAEQVPAERIVDVDRCVRETRHLEQRRLGTRVGIHVRVVVEVIATEVGEYRGVDVDRLDAALVERVRRDLQDEGVEAVVSQCRELAMNLDRTRSGERHGLQPIRGTGTQRAHDRAAIAAGSCREMGHARLAVGSGHRSNGQALRRISVEAGCGMSDRTRDIRNPDHHRPVVVPHRSRAALDDDGRRAGCDCVAGEPPRIDPPTPACEEQRSGYDGAAVVAHRRHQPVQCGGDRRVPLQEHSQARTGGCPARGHYHGVLSELPSDAAAAMLITGLRIVSGSSGAIPSTRNEPSTMSENTGAATAPP